MIGRIGARTIVAGAGTVIFTMGIVAHKFYRPVFGGIGAVAANTFNFVFRRKKKRGRGKKNSE